MCEPVTATVAATAATEAAVATTLLGPTLFAASSGAGVVGAVSGVSAVSTGFSLGSAFTSAFNFATNPAFSFGSQIVGFGVQIAGQQQQAAFQRQQLAFQQAQIRNRQAAVEQDIKQRLIQLEVNEGIIGDQGNIARGALRAEAAGRGVLVDKGSEADKTEELAGDIALQKLVNRQEVSLQNRQDRIIASGLQSDSALLDFQSAEAQRTSRFKQLGAGLDLAKGFSKFRFNNGQLAFRT